VQAQFGESIFDSVYAQIWAFLIVWVHASARFFSIFSSVLCACDMFRLQCTVNFCLISNKYKNQQRTNMTVPQKQEFDLKEVNVSQKDYYF
jgi:hypothetical protein